jgi:VanZ family protein
MARNAQSRLLQNENGKPEMRKMFHIIQRGWKIITLLTFVTITLLSLWPVETLPAIPGSDKTHHFIAYTALMFPVALRQPRYWLILGIFFVGWSGMIELVQPYVNRYAEWQDMLANTGGIIIGLLSGIWIKASST